MNKNELSIALKLLERYSPTQLKIIGAVMLGAKRIADIAEVAQISQSAVKGSQGANFLVEQGTLKSKLIELEHGGKKGIVYSLA